MFEYTCVGENVTQIVTVVRRMALTIKNKEAILLFKIASKPNPHFIVKHAVPCSIDSTHRGEVRKGDFPEDLH